MKNNNLFLLMAAVFALISCGTANRSAYYSGPQFRNSIYYTPGNTGSQAYAQEQKHLQDLQERTSNASGNYAMEQQYSNGQDTRAIYVGDNNQVDIQYTPGTTYAIMDDQESYEARLRKFDSPFYTINIEINDPYPWWGYSYRWYNPYWSRWYPGWRSPWYGSWYSWYGPSWRWDWHYSWGWYDPFYDPWWGHAYWPGHWPGYWPSHRPGYHPGHHPGHHPGAGPGARPHDHREIYYGKRNSTPTYNGGGRGNSSVGNNYVAGRPNTGSVTRRPSNVTQINGSSTREPQMNAAGNNRNDRVQNAATQQTGGNQYRRVAPGQQTKSGTVTTGRTPQQSKGNSTYSKTNSGNRNNNSGSYTRSSRSTGSSSYNNNSSSHQTRSTYSSGGGATRSTGSSSSGGGSSYRRR